MTCSSRILKKNFINIPLITLKNSFPVSHVMLVKLISKYMTKIVVIWWWLVGNERSSSRGSISLLNLPPTIHLFTVFHIPATKSLEKVDHNIRIVPMHFMY